MQTVSVTCEAGEIQGRVKEEALIRGNSLRATTGGQFAL